ncbi:hypothetical protein JQS43_21800 [Natronosporangium hydrolyticum]|uniref:Uncharacterized protein n=1 Tax=Natronosporangium hydrolyticum TaxID=2811111 RepID=A0A895YFE5_9ACTN|nr:hypothetical protein [Natronosporangium hydrolyticum]QSB14133.1 hypothetical protein JQS43_21800 [Natronosporangium hydrolyticum]
MSQPTDPPPPTSPEPTPDEPTPDDPQPEGPPPDAAPPEALPADTPPAVEEAPPEPDSAEPDSAEPDSAEPDSAEPDAGHADPEPAESPVRRGVRLTALIAGSAVIGALVVAAAGFAALQFFSEETPVVGDCLTEAATADDMSVVDCEGGDAYWSVVGADGTWQYGEFEAAQAGEVCAEHPTTQQALWITSERTVGAESEGEVVCLEPVAGTPDDAQDSD